MATLVAGIRALLAKDPLILDKLADEEGADVIVLQETKLQEKHMDEVDARVLAAFPHRVWNCSTARLGYSGTALFSRVAPLAMWSGSAPVPYSQLASILRRTCGASEHGPPSCSTQHTAVSYPSVPDNVP